MEWFFPGKTKKKDNKDTTFDLQPIYLRDEFVKQCITDADLMLLVALPTAIDLNEWLATNTIGFVEHLNLFCGALSEYCSVSTCPSMLVPGNIPVSWSDEKGKKVKCSAVQYMNYALVYSQRCCSDETIFPTKYDKPFPSTLAVVLKKIYRCLLNILAHIYHCHYAHLVLLQLNGHLNTIAHHFIIFVKTFLLIEEKDLSLLADLFTKLQQVSVYRLGELVAVSSSHYSDGDTGSRTEKWAEENLNSGVQEEEKENVDSHKECTITTITI